MYLFREWCGAVAGLVFINVVIISFHRQNPPFVEKGENGKKNAGCYIVSAWNVGRGICGYEQYDFVERKNGKYRLKFYPLEWFVGVACLSLYTWMTGNAWDSIWQEPKMLLLPYLSLFLAFLDLWFIANNGSVVARICFYTYVKKHKKGKRR